MKRRCNILFIALFFCIHPAHAQKQTLLERSYHPPVERATIRYFLEDINRTPGIVIEYSSNNIDTGKMVVLARFPASLEDILKQVLKDQKVSLVEKNDKLILVPSSVTYAENNPAPLYSLFGFIKDGSSSEPLPDASILEVSRRNGTVSNTHGYFTLMLPAGKQTILISYAGYGTRQLVIELKNNKRIDIELAASSDMEEAAVVSGTNNPEQRGADNVHTGDNSFNMMLGEPDVVPSIAACCRLL